MKVGICSPTSALFKAVTLLLPIEGGMWLEARWKLSQRVDGFLVGSTFGGRNIIVPVASKSGQPLKRLHHVWTGDDKSHPISSFEELGIAPVLNYGVFISPTNSTHFFQEVGVDKIRLIPHYGSAFLQSLELALDNEALARLEEAEKTKDAKASDAAIEWRRSWDGVLSQLKKWFDATFQM